MIREKHTKAVALSENRFGAVFFTALIVLAVCAALVGRAKGEEPSAAARSALAMTFGTHTPDPFAPANKATKHDCGCSDPADCTCPPGACDCAGCKATPKVGDTKVTDDPSRPWTFGYGREYGWNELGWYRPAVTYRTSYQPAPVYYAPPPVFQGGFGGGFNDGGGGSC